MFVHRLYIPAAAIVCGLMLLWSTAFSRSHTFPDLLAPSIGDVRLVNYSCQSETSVEGTVEVYYDDGVNGPRWGYVCKSSALPYTAEVVCRQLGYSDGNLNVCEEHPQENEATDSGHILRQASTNRVQVAGGSSCGDDPPKNYSNDPVWLSDIHCGENNNFSHILRCNHTVSYGDPGNCDYLKICCNQRLKLYDGQVHLCAPAGFPNDTQSTSLGVVQVFLYNSWGGVNQYNTNVPLRSYEADSICRQLGYTNAVTSYTMTVGSGKTIQSLDFGHCASKTKNAINAWFKTDDGTLKCERSQDCFGCCFAYPSDKPCPNSECSFTMDVVVKCEFDTSIAGDVKGGSAELCKYNKTHQLSSQACSVPQAAQTPQDWKLLFEIAVGVVGLLTLILFCALLGCCVYCVCQYRNRARAGDGDRRGQQRLLRQQDDEN